MRRGTDDTSPARISASSEYLVAKWRPDSSEHASIKGTPIESGERTFDSLTSLEVFLLSDFAIDLADLTPAAA
jgi:hypothetical protein